MRVNQVIVIPAFNNCGNLGRYYGKACEYDVVNSYVETLCEFLEHDRITYQVITDKDELIYPNSLILHCGAGWNKAPTKSKNNHSLVAYSQSTSKKLAEIALETVSEWGKCYVDLSHKSREIATYPDNANLDIENTFALYIEPFRLNGPMYEEYLKACPTLGRMLAQCVFEFLAARNEQPTMMSAYKSS